MSACAPQAVPALSPQDFQNIAAAAALTVVAEVMMAVPTATPLPPTETASSPLPADRRPGYDHAGERTSDNCCDIHSAAAFRLHRGPLQQAAHLLAGRLTARFSVENSTKHQRKVVLSLYVVTPLGECGYLADLSSGPAGLYSAAAFVDGEANFKVFGNFQNQEGSWKIVIRNDKIMAMGNCYPSC